MTTTTIDLGSPATVVITVLEGRGGTLEVTVTRGGTAVDLTGATIRYYAATSPTAISKTVGSGITINANPLLGKFQIAFTGAETTGKGALSVIDHDCAMKLPGRDMETVFNGQLRIGKTLFTSMT